MRQLLFIVSVVLIGVILYTQLPAVQYSTKKQTAMLFGASTYGERLGKTVDEVVKNIRYMDKTRGQRSYITHAHVLAILCQENPRLNIQIRNGEGRHEGLTQVITSTWYGLIRGKMAGGQCRYIAKLENGACGTIRSRTANPRCSIETGACLYNYNLKRCRGNAACAYNIYNTGSSRRRANGLGSFVRAHQALSKGQLCAKSRGNWLVWRAMRKKIAQLTGGLFRTNDAQHILTSAMGWPKDPSKFPSVKNLGNQWWKTSPGKSLSQFLNGNKNSGGGNGGSMPKKNEMPYRNNTGSKKSGWFDNYFGKNNNKPRITSTSQKRRSAELSCRKQSNNNVLLRWVCPAGTSMSRGYTTNNGRFVTHGANIGSTAVRYNSQSTYIVQCIKGSSLFAEAKCKPNSSDQEVVDSGVEKKYVNKIPKGVVLHLDYNKNGDIVWSTLGASSCTIDVGGITGTGTSGKVRVGKPSETTLVELRCATSAGEAVRYKKIVVK